MSTVTADIDYVTDAGVTTFSANTPAGEAFLKAPTVTVPSSEVVATVVKAKAEGLTIMPAL
jgi:hypothetical protein